MNNYQGKILIDGEWLSSDSSETIATINPSDGIEFERIARGTAKDVDRAVQSAQNAIEGKWGKTTAAERGRLLQKLSKLILENEDELTEMFRSKLFMKSLLESGY